MYIVWNIGNNDISNTFLYGYGERKRIINEFGKALVAYLFFSACSKFIGEVGGWIIDKDKGVLLAMALEDILSFIKYHSTS